MMYKVKLLLYFFLLGLSHFWLNIQKCCRNVKHLKRLLQAATKTLVTKANWSTGVEATYSLWEVVVIILLTPG